MCRGHAQPLRHSPRHAENEGNIRALSPIQKSPSHFKPSDPHTPCRCAKASKNQKARPVNHQAPKPQNARPRRSQPAGDKRLADQKPCLQATAQLAFCLHALSKDSRSGLNLLNILSNRLLALAQRINQATPSPAAPSHTSCPPPPASASGAPKTSWTSRTTHAPRLGEINRDLTPISDPDFKPTCPGSMNNWDLTPIKTTRWLTGPFSG